MRKQNHRFITVLLGVGVFCIASVAQAGKPQLDNGTLISQEDPYSSSSVQEVSNLFESHAVYGRLSTESTVDIYKVTADKDGEQTVRLMTRGAASQPALILMDPTDATAPEELNIPLPAPEYHPVLVKALETPKDHRETFLGQSFKVGSEQKFAFQKDKTYYLIVLDPYAQPGSYALAFGDGKAWELKDVFTSFGTWFKLQTDTYSGISPFSFTSALVPLVLFLLGLSLILGLFVIYHGLSFMANRSKAAGYLLVKLQKFDKIANWVALWFTAIGGYIYFDKKGWVGIPFVMVLVFIALIAAVLVRTLRVSPQVEELEVTKKEATIPLTLRKKLVASFVVELVAIGAILTLLSLYLYK
ncbi:MAG: hypothetical protein K0S20_533 [Patescibacteria group bacterium]|jgi:hypothetical protein|nr:hypothetical protein [Patescibacteria group bacterium]